MKYDGCGFWVSIYFRRAVRTVRPRTVMAIDLNFDNVTLAVFTLSGRPLRLRRFKVPHRKILTHRVWIERIQGRYPRSWRFVKDVRRVIERHGERIRNISWDYAHRVGDLIAELALRYRSVVVLEDPEKLRENGKRDRRFNKRLGLWFYHRVQFCVEYEAMERGLQVAKVNPRGTSSRCPRCGGRLFEDGYRVLRCRKCGFVGDRDVIATVNLYRRYVSKHPRCGGLGVPPNAPESDEDPSGMRGNRDEVMTALTYMNLYGN